MWEQDLFLSNSEILELANGNIWANYNQICIKTSWGLDSKKTYKKCLYVYYLVVAQGGYWIIQNHDNLDKYDIFKKI